jgi:secreted trypsin-like serine protease
MAAVGLGAGALVGAASADAAAHTRVHPEIIGGQPVPAGALGQLAYIQDEVSASSYLACTGTVVSPNLVLTAGHCAQDEASGAVQPASGFLVATGRTELADTATGQVSAVSRVIVYPGYDLATRDGDAALLELRTPTTAPAIQLADSGQSALWQPGSDLAIAGWGLTDGSGAAAPPTQLQAAATVTQSLGYCAENASLAGSGFDPAAQLCATDPPAYQTGTCLGDSGGPLLADYGGDDPIEVGITSWGVSTPGTSCNTDYPSFFTRAATISPWVRSWARMLAPPPSRTPTPAPKPTPIPTRAPVALPEAGTYAGHSSQHRRVRLRVTAARGSIAALRFAYRLRCRDGRRPTHVVTFRHLAISDLTFGAKLRIGRGERFAVAGAFDTTGAVSGTMRTTWHSARHGICRSGRLRFKARR